MKFKRQAKEFPGFLLNFSASGGKGAGIDVSRRDAQLQASVPGLSLLTGASLDELQASLEEAYRDRTALSADLVQAQFRLYVAQAVQFISYGFIVGFFIKPIRRWRQSMQDHLADLDRQLNNTSIAIDLELDPVSAARYRQVMERYQALQRSKKIWDITATVAQDRKATRSAASEAVTRVAVSFRLSEMEVIRCGFQALHFENKNGGDLFIYPGFVIMTTSRRSFAMMPLSQFRIDCQQQQFLEEGRIPEDAQMIGKTWAKVNKNGTPDRRFKENYEIPIVRYGQLELSSPTGLSETYSVSNYDAAKDFVDAFTAYQKLFNN